MAPSLRAYLCVFLCLAATAEAAKATPMEKVISLLKDLSTKVAAEGKKEAAQYDKFACFCKDNADKKLYNIEKSEAKIKDLNAEIKELSGDIAKLGGEISGLSKEISRLETEIDTKTQKREKQHAEYARRAKDMNEAIDACGAAIAALKDSKSAMQGAKVTNLVQVASRVKSPGAVSLLAKLAGAPKFQYQSNDIIATIEDLMAEFKANKKDLDFTEHDINAAFESDRLGLSNEKKFAEKERAEKEAISEEKTETMEAAKSDRDDETNDMNADQSFLDDLTAKCEKTAQLFDQRSQSRSAELSALSSATEELQKGAVKQFSANKKLVGLQLRKAAKPVAASFVQISSVQHQKSDHMVFQRVRDFLNNAAERTGSGALSAVAMRVQLAADHFVKVRGLIKDLIAKLKADAKSEATQKGNCDVGMADATSDRDQANAAIEVANAKITTQTATKNALDDEMQTLTAQIAELKKELNEATELRENDKADNEKTVDTAEEGVAAVTNAIDILDKYYAFAQMQTSKYVPPISDRDGNTVGDVAPEFASEEYHGAGEESGGIVGILQVILSDFERTVKQTNKNEKEAQSAFDDMEKETNDSVTRKNKRITKAEAEKTEAENQILEQEQALSDAKDLLESGLKALEELESTCVKGEETWEERKQKREDEVEALKEALAIFEDWQGF